MLDFALALATLAGKIILFLIAIKIFWTLITKGKGILSDLVDSVFMGMRTATKVIQRWLFQKYKGKEETKAPPVQPEAPQPQPQPQAYQPQPQPTVEQPPAWGSGPSVPPPYQW